MFPRSKRIRALVLTSFLFSVLGCKARQFNTSVSNIENVEAPTATPTVDATPTLTPSKRVLAVSQRMENLLYEFQHTCNFLAPFAATYVTMTRNVLYEVNKQNFENNNDLAIFVELFANQFFNAYNKYQTGNLEGVPKPWVYAFDRAKKRVNLAMQDVFLGMNAHINYDLIITLYEAVEVQKLIFTKRDYDKINTIIKDASMPTQEAIANDYAPAAHILKVFGTGTNEYLSSRFVSIWRNSSWDEGHKLIAASRRGEFESVRREIESRAYSLAKYISPESLFVVNTYRLDQCRKNFPGSVR